MRKASIVALLHRSINKTQFLRRTLMAALLHNNRPAQTHIAVLACSNNHAQALRGTPMILMVGLLRRSNVAKTHMVAPTRNNNNMLPSTVRSRMRITILIR